MRYFPFFPPYGTISVRRVPWNGQIYIIYTISARIFYVIGGLYPRVNICEVEVSLLYTRNITLIYPTVSDNCILMIVFSNYHSRLGRIDWITFVFRMCTIFVFNHNQDFVYKNTTEHSSCEMCFQIKKRSWLTTIKSICFAYMSHFFLQFFRRLILSRLVTDITFYNTDTSVKIIA